MVSPTAPACVAQDELEQVLLERVLAAPVARVELGTELTGVLARPDGIRAGLRDVRTGAPRTVHARYMVAADGARSAVRGALGIPLIGPEHLMEGATTLFRAPLWDVVGDHRHLLYSVTHPATPAVFLPAGPSDRWLVGFRNDGADAPDERRAVRGIRLAAGVPDLPVRSARRAARRCSPAPTARRSACCGRTPSPPRRCARRSPRRGSAARTPGRGLWPRTCCRAGPRRAR